MNKFIFILILITVGKCVRAQNYPPINNSSSWYINSFTWNLNYNFWIIAEKDTVISSLIYTKYIQLGSNNPATFVRENVNAKKVYRLLNGSDVLMFDFTLHLGDTITLGWGLKYVVDVEDSINVAFGKRRRLILNHYSGNMIVTYEVWIEGVGNRHHPVIPLFELGPDPCNIICSYQDGITVVTNANCPAQSVLGIDKDFNRGNLTIFPNPCTSVATIKTENCFTEARLLLYNSFGQIVKEMENISGETILINRGNLPGGLYFLKIIENNKVLAPAHKLIIDQ